MPTLESIRIDIRDVDHEWFRDVAAFYDRDGDRYLFPRESAERLGEFDEETGNFWLLDGTVEATADEGSETGEDVAAWSVACGQLKTKSGGSLKR